MNQLKSPLPLESAFASAADTPEARVAAAVAALRAGRGVIVTDDADP